MIPKFNQHDYCQMEMLKTEPRAGNMTLKVILFSLFWCSGGVPDHLPKSLYGRSACESSIKVEEGVVL